MWQGLRALWGILARRFFVVFVFRPAKSNNPRAFTVYHHFAVWPVVRP